MSTLVEIIKDNNLFKKDFTNGTDKEFLHYYVSNFYQEAFAPLQHKKIKLLEIGTCTGASLKMWRLFFTNAEIVGIDINCYVIPEYMASGINYNFCDAYDKEVVDNLGFYDIIIDDGPHSLESQLKFVDLYYDKLLPDGLMIIEDIHTNNIQTIYDKFKNKFNKDPNIVDKRVETGNADEVIIWATKDN